MDVSSSDQSHAWILVKNISMKAMILVMSVELVSKFRSTIQSLQFNCHFSQKQFFKIRHYPSLKSLLVLAISCHLKSHEIIKRVLSLNPQLQILNLSDFRTLSVKTIPMIAKYCLNLTLMSPCQFLGDR
jgi:hypothetical protein